jgi:hypothetical protein
METAFEAGSRAAETALRAAEAGDAAALRSLVDLHGPARKSATKLRHRIDVSLSARGTGRARPDA